MGDSLLELAFLFGVSVECGEQQGLGFVGPGDLLQQLQTVFLFRRPSL